MDVITIDFETAYDKDYSLSKMTTEAYIRDRRFEIIGVGIKINKHPSDWYSGENPGKFLKSLDYSKAAILCHNAAFDGAILSWKLGIKPKLWLDTLSMARPLHSMTMSCSLASLASHYGLGQKGTEVVNALGKWRKDFSRQDLDAYGKYCCNDADLTYALFNKLKSSYSAMELMAIDTLIRMYTEPTIELDTDLLMDHLNEVRERKEKLLMSVTELVGGGDPSDVMMSNPKFAAALRALNVDVPMKTSPTSGAPAFAFAKTDEGMLKLLEHPDEQVQALVAARLGVKSTIEETRTTSLINVAGRGSLPIMLNYYGAHTGRFSGGDKMNLQNLPSRGNSTIRRALKAPEGHVLIACDSSQIEARIVAWLAGQEDLVEAFRQKRDVYSEFATEIYGRTITKKDVAERFVGKTCILGLGYGMGAVKLQRSLELGSGGVSVKMDLVETEKIVRLYRNKNHRIGGFWKRCDWAIQQMASGGTGQLHDILSFSGETIGIEGKHKLRYPLLRQRSDSSRMAYISSARDYKKAAVERLNPDAEHDPTIWTDIYGGKMTENIVQYLAAIAIREQMVAISAKYKVVFQVHDELIIVAPEAQSEQAEQDVIRIMSTPPVWAPDLPVACESGRASNYGDC
jgi:DNA polymerase